MIYRGKQVRLQKAYLFFEIIIRKKGVMNIVDVFGGYVDKFSQTSPSRAALAARTGWEAQKIRQKLTTDKMLMPADRYLAELMMNTMIRPLKTPDQSAIVSIFTPCELLQEVGLNPYNVEGFSCYLAGTHIERAVFSRRKQWHVRDAVQLS